MEVCSILQEDDDWELLTIIQGTKEIAEVNHDVRTQASNMFLLWSGEGVEEDDWYEGVGVRNLCTFYTPSTFNGGPTCVLFLTHYRLFLVNPTSNTSTYVPLMMISKAEQSNSSISDHTVTVVTKNLRSYICDFQSTNDTCSFLTKLSQRTRARPPQEYFSFSAEPEDIGGEALFKYDYEQDMARLGLISLEGNGDMVGFCISNLNKHYKLCTSYPPQVIVPQGVSDDDIKASAAFRARKRFPVVVWRCPTTNAVLARAGQPKTGVITLLQNTRNSHDETLIASIRMACPSQKLCIIDARSFANASANCVTGGGYETPDVYKGCTVEFMGLVNIHAVRESYNRLRTVCQDGQSEHRGWLSALESTGWLEHISNILTASVTVADKMCQGVSVLVHCSDGWDRTPQLISLAQLLLDDHYRTLEGFLQLIYKDWLLFGHCFAKRCGHRHSTGDSQKDSDQSPIFVQWLDCVLQLTRMFPTAFDFDEVLLCFLGEHVYSCLFREFICNLQKERKDHVLTKPSLAAYIMAQPQCTYTNPNYYPVIGSLLPTSTAVRCMTFWRAYHLGEHIKANPKKAQAHFVDLKVLYRAAQLKIQKDLLKELFLAWHTYTVKVQARRHMIRQMCRAILLEEVLTAVDEQIDKGAFQVVQPSDGRVETLGNTKHALWVPDEAVAHCYHCSASFSYIYRRKHHCRNCGMVVCSECSQSKSTIPGNNFRLVMVRVCDPCFRLLNPIAHRRLSELRAQRGTCDHIDGMESLSYATNLEEEKDRIVHSLQSLANIEDKGDQ